MGVWYPHCMQVPKVAMLTLPWRNACTVPSVGNPSALTFTISPLQPMRCAEQDLA